MYVLKFRVLHCVDTFCSIQWFYKQKQSSWSDWVDAQVDLLLIMHMK